MKRFAFVALVVALAVQSIWQASAWNTVPHDMNFWYALFMIAGLGVVASTRGRATWASFLMRLGLGLDFTATTLDRYGVFGPYGTRGVNWGDFAHFINYTHTVNAFLPASFAPFLAYAANACEIVLAITLILGVRTQLACTGATLLLLAYGCAMTVSLGFASQLPYAVFLLCAGAWYMSTIDASFLSLDRLFSSFAKRSGAAPRRDILHKQSP